MTALEKINQRERQILVHSYLYYELDESVVDDFAFTRWTYDLVDLMSSHPKEFEQSVYYKDFKDYEGATGHGLDYKKPEIVRVATRLLRG